MKNAQLPASAATMKPTSASSENHFTKGCTFAAKAGSFARIQRPARNGTPMMRKMSTSICHGLSSTAVEKVMCGRMQRAPERDAQRQHEDVDQVRHRRHRHRQRDVAARAVGEHLRDVPRRAAGDEDHAERHRGRHREDQRQSERHRRQHDELGQDRDDERLRLAGHDLEVVGRGVERDPEHDEAQDHVQDDEGLGVEVEDDVVDVHGEAVRARPAAGAI